MKESVFQKKLINRLESEFEGCLVFKNDPNYRQGICDLLVLYNDRWAALEVKRSSKASHQPNQEYYVDRLDKMSFAAFVYPENEEIILDGLRKAFRA